MDFYAECGVIEKQQSNTIKCLSVCLFVFVLLSLSMSLFLSVCLCVSQFLHLSFCQSVSVSLYRSICQSDCMPLCFSDCRSSSLSVSRNLFISVCQLICVSLYICICFFICLSDTVQNRGPVSCRISRTYREWTYSPLIGQYFIGHFYWWVGLKLFWIWMTSPYFLKIGNTVSFLSWHFLSKPRHWVFPTTLTKISLIQEVFNEFPCGKKPNQDKA